MPPWKREAGIYDTSRSETMKGTSARGSRRARESLQGPSPRIAIRFLIVNILIFLMFPIFVAFLIYFSFEVSSDLLVFYITLPDSGWRHFGRHHHSDTSATEQRASSDSQPAEINTNINSIIINSHTSHCVYYSPSRIQIKFPVQFTQAPIRLTPNLQTTTCFTSLPQLLQPYHHHN